MKNVSDSLAVRVGILKLNSFNFSEIKQTFPKEVFTPDNLKKKEKINVKYIKKYINNLIYYC